MFQLVIVVIAIGLLAIVMVGGLNYISTDVGVRTDTIRQISVSRNAIESGLSSYRLANGGHLPPAESAGQSLDWKAMLDGYVEPNGFRAPQNMQWRLVQHADRKFLCLETAESAALSEAVVTALEQSAKSAIGVVSTECSSVATTDRSALLQQGAQASLVVPVAF